MTRHSRVAAAVLLVLSAAGVTAATVERVSVEHALRLLAEHGHAVVFSSDTVAADATIEITAATPEAVRAGLAPQGLTLIRSGRFWVVAPLAEAGSAVQPGTERRRPADRLETVIVTGTRYRLPEGMSGAGATTLTAQELNTTPALGGDAVRVVNRLPGMSSVGVSASPLVRGGAEDETLIRIDGVELIEPFHLADFQSIFSTVDDRTIESINFYSGGFPARYGNRMSGVMEISTHGAPHTRASEVGLSTYTAIANTRGHSDDERLWWLGSVRRGDLDPLTDRIDSRTGSPKYWDAYGSIGHALSRATYVTIGGLLSRDDVEFNDGEETAHSDIDNKYVWLRLDHDHSSTSRSSTVLSFVDAQRRKRLNSPDNDEDSAGFLDYQRDTKRLTLRSDWSIAAGVAIIETGASVELARSKYVAAGLVDRGDMGVLLGRPALEALDTRTTVDGPAYGVYAAIDLPLTDTISIQPGLRFDAQHYDPRGATNHVSPRLGVLWQPTPFVTARLTAGRFYQPEAIHEMQVTDGIDRFQAPQRADHFIAGLDIDPTERLSLRAEAYYKDYGDPKMRFENAFNPFVILPELEPDRVAVTANSARVRGFDFEGRYELATNLSAVLRYGYLDAEDRINQQWVSRRWSQRSTVNAIIAWHGEATEFAAALTWHTGWYSADPPPFTTGPMAVEDILNGTELAEYVSLDLRAARRFKFSRSEVTIYADLTNVFDRDNQAGIDYDAIAVPGGWTLLPDEEVLLPYIPSVGFLIRF